MSLERMISLPVDTTRSDYAIFTGIHVHGPEADFVWPSLCDTIVKGNKIDINLAQEVG